MNERIKELLEQAGVKYVTMPKDTVYEKFAQLIVQECVDVLSDKRFVNVRPSMDIAGAMINQHLGLE